MYIDAERVTKEFVIQSKPISVLQDITLAIGEGAFICLLGPSGCGKSTFLRCLAGLETPTSGSLKVAGRKVEGPGPDRAMVFQDYALFPWCTVEQNILFGLNLRRNRRVRSRAAADILKELVTLVGLTGFEKAYPYQISGGMRQRVGIARALAVNPDALLMDEPFAAIDAITRESLQSQLLEIWAKTGKTILFVTHSVEEATLLADDVYVFGARPATIRERVTVDLPRPRNLTDRRLVEIAGRLRDSIHAGMQEGR